MGNVSIAPQDHRALGALADLGGHIKQLRKSHNLSAQSLASIAGISRVTLHRVESGEPGVAAGAYAAVLAALGSTLAATGQSVDFALPSYVYVDDYPVLRSMSWQLREGILITPAEAWQIYSRHSDLLDTSVVALQEARLLRALKRKFGETNA